jgi:L-ascorbate metabolism protein UlaG (beta-lactamase superfamily)
MQGYGVVNPRDAVDGALRGGIAPTKPTGFVSPFVRRDNRISFYYRNDNAKTVSVAGDFNNWDKTKDMMVRDEDRIWNIEIYFPLPGTYRYKFVIDGEIWTPDPNNDRQENDGYMGMNSIFIVETLGEAGEILSEIKDWLIYNTPESGNKFIRKEAIVRLGRLLDLSSSPKSPEIREYYIDRMEDTVRKLEKHIHYKKATIWQLYNDGYIIQVPQEDEKLKLNIGFDVVSGRHVWGVQWDIPDHIVESIADSMDVLFISHRHPDHLDLDIANRMIKSGKVVIVPQMIIDLFRPGAVGISVDEVKEITDTEGKTINLTVKANLGDHVYDKGRKIDLLYYEVTVESPILNKDKKELKIIHTSDHDYTKSFKSSENVDILFAKCGDINPDYSPSQSMEILLARCNPGLVIPAHLEEIGHPIAGGRESYESAYRLINKCSVPVAILTWGESINYPPDFSGVDTTQPKELATEQKSTKF